MADAKAAGEKPVPTDTPEYGCITDLAAQQAATADKSAKTAKSGETETTEKE